MVSQLGLGFGEEIVCECGATYYGSLPEVCLFCEIEKQNKIIIRFKKDSGFRVAVHNCAGCFYSSFVENGKLSCLYLTNEGIEFEVKANCICNCWSDGTENVMDEDNG